MQPNKNPLRSEFVLEAKVAHLFKKLEELERDKIELQKLQDRIASDRDYSDELKRTFVAEIEKMDAQKKELLQIPVRTENLGTAPLSPVEANSTPETEIPSLEKKKTDKPPRKY